MAVNPLLAELSPCLCRFAVALAFESMLFQSVFAQDATSKQSISSPGALLAEFDLNGDDQISRPELFFGRAGNELLPQERILAPEHERLFRGADVNCDGLLNEDEIKLYSGRYVELARAAVTEQALRKLRLPAFRAWDADGSGSLSREEWLARDGAMDAESSYQFRLCDFDGDGSLSFQESVCTTGYGKGLHEPGVPDPVVDEMERVYERIAGSLSIGRCETTGVPLSKVLAQSKKEIRYLEDISGWDINGDRALTRSEIRYGLELAFGIRLKGGMLLRRPNGQVFNLRTHGYFDLDKDGQLSRAEFVQKYWFKDRADEMFTKVDLNSDDALSRAEWSRCYLDDLFWVDALADFSRFDTDRNAIISPKEILSGARSFEKNIAKHIFPAFDVDGDGSLSFREYRGTPLGAPILDWNRIRWDKNEDAQLSVKEYQTDALPEARGAAALFLSRLDQDDDGSLSRDELEFNVAWSKLPPEIAFDTLDDDHDNNLTLQEVLMPFGKSAGPEGERSAQKKLAKLENAFAVSDVDRDAVLSKGEYMDPRSLIVEAIGGRRAAVRLRSESVATGTGGSSRWNWRAIGLVGFNVLIIVGLGWLVYRSAFKTRK